MPDAQMMFGWHCRSPRDILPRSINASVTHWPRSNFFIDIAESADLKPWLGSMTGHGNGDASLQSSSEEGQATSRIVLVGRCDAAPHSS
jgi:hypothetical protein